MTGAEDESHTWWQGPDVVFEDELAYAVGLRSWTIPKARRKRAREYGEGAWRIPSEQLTVLYVDCGYGFAAILGFESPYPAESPEFAAAVASFCARLAEASARSD